MSTLKDLLKNVPVEWKTLEEITLPVTAPSKIKKENYREKGEFPIIDQGINFIAGYTDITFTLVKKGEYVIFGDHSEHIKFADFAFIQGADGLKILRVPTNNTKYIYYSFLNFYEKELSYKRHWTNAKKTLIPIPYPNDPEKSLAIQQEIVRLLDELTEQKNILTEALSTEIENRKKQYYFYREQLFQFEGKEVDILPLGHENIGKFTRGSGLQKKDFTESGVGCIHYGQIYTYYGTSTKETKSFVSVDFAKNARKAKKGDLVIATTSENDEDVCKAVAWLGDQDIAVSSDACFYSHNLNPKYVAYYFQTEQFQVQKRKYITGIKVRRVNVNDLEKITIPNPKLLEQNHIVDLLDKFDEANKAIILKLEKEIELRNKEYEYYRNLLLTFE